MKIKLIFSILIALFASYNASCQSLAVVEISTDLINETVFNINSLKITNTQSVSVSGNFSSEVSVVIVPIANTSMLFTPVNTSGVILPGDGTTVIKIKPPGGGIINGLSKRLLVSIFPNPVQSTLNFETTNGEVNSYSVYDSNGINILSEKIEPTNNGLINVNKLVSGIYILKLNLVTGEQLTIKFIKN